MVQEKRLRFALFGNEYQPKKSVAVGLLLNVLAERGAEVSTERSYREFLLRERLATAALTGEPFDRHNFTADIAIAVGGDGTFLKAAGSVGVKGIPLVGVNTGRLGFLASVLPSEIHDAVAALINGTYSVERHSVLMLQTEGEQLQGIPYALNDIAILKRDNAAMITIEVSVGGEPLVTYLADGLVVTTPTGSTAYNLSVGGPIIVPRVGAICLTAVAPHSLSLRPVVISDDEVLRLSVQSRSHNFLVAVDGRSEKLADGTTLTIRKANYTLNIIKCSQRRYFSTLREKLLWGVDGRG